MDETEVKHVLEAALLAAGRPLPIDKLQQLFVKKGPDVDRPLIRRSLEALAADYEGRGLELKEVSSGFRVQVRRSMSDWLQPLWEERAPRYTRALLETLSLIAYRQPITRGEIEEVRGVAVSTNIIRTLAERGWIRVVGHRDVPGRPEMFGTTKEFLDYFGLKSLEDLPPLAEIRDGLPEQSPQSDFLEVLETVQAEAPVDDGGGPEPAESPDEEVTQTGVLKSGTVPASPGSTSPADSSEGREQTMTADDRATEGSDGVPAGTLESG